MLFLFMLMMMLELRKMVFVRGLQLLHLLLQLQNLVFEGDALLALHRRLALRRADGQHEAKESKSKQILTHGSEESSDTGLGLFRYTTMPRKAKPAAPLFKRRRSVSFQVPAEADGLEN